MKDNRFDDPNLILFPVRGLRIMATHSRVPEFQSSRVPEFYGCQVLIVVRVKGCWVLEFWNLGGCHSYQDIMIVRLPALANSENLTTMTTITTLTTMKTILWMICGHLCYLW